jgi:putative ABC transport system substrate-binding protein
MRRREFITFVGGAAVAWPIASRAQQPERVRRIGVLLNGSSSDPELQRRYTAFRRGLAALGWVEEKNLHVEIRWGVGDAERVHAHARELVQLAPEIIFSNGTPATAALKRATSSIPIVFAIVADPVSDGFAASLSHPGGNITGFSSFDSEIGGKWMELLKELAPEVKRTALLFNPQTAPGGRPIFDATVL